MAVPNKAIRFLSEFLAEELPFQSGADALRSRTRVVQQMAENAGAKYALGSENSLIHFGRCKLLDGQSAYLVDYKFLNYAPDLWRSSQSQWDKVGSVFDDQKGIRRKMLTLLQQMHESLIKNKMDADVSDIMEVLHKSEFSKMELVALCEVEELLRKCDAEKRYPRGSFHQILLDCLSLLADLKVGKSDTVLSIARALGVDQFSGADPLQAQELVRSNLALTKSDEIERCAKAYRRVIDGYLEVEAELKAELSAALEAYLNPPDGGSSESSSSAESIEWIEVTGEFQYRSDLSCIRYRSRVFSVCEKVRSSLGRLIRGFRHQDDVSCLPTKEDLLGESRYSPKNLREFKVKKTLFPHEPLRSLVQFDRDRGGYYLALEPDESKAA